MKKVYKSIIAMLIISTMLGVTACGSTAKQTSDVAESGSVSGTAEEEQAAVGTEEMAEAEEETATGTEEETESMTFPDVDYEEWFVDDDGNKLWGYHTPLGFIKDEEQSGARAAYYSRDGEYEEEINIVCSQDTDGKWEEWYKTGNADTDLYFDNEGHVSVIENGTIETVYGEFKDFLLVDDREEWGDLEKAILWMPSGWCVHIQISTTGSSSYWGTMNHLLDILTGEKQEEVAIEDGYDNYLCASTGERIFGFNNVDGLTAREDVGGMSMGNNDFTMHIMEDNQLTSVYEEGEEKLYFGESQDGEALYRNFEYKEEIDTIYGTVKLYQEAAEIFTSENQMIEEFAIFRVNGRYIYVNYYRYDGAEYQGTLKNIIETQLLGTKTAEETDNTAEEAES